MNTPFGNSITTAEHAIALMLALARQMPAADRSTQAGKWEKTRFMGVELYAKTLGLIGCGNIGAIVADRALGLKMKVIAYDPFLSPERAVELGVEKVELDDLLATRRFHLAAHAADRRDQEHHRRRGDRQDEEGRAHHQLRARRTRRSRRISKAALDSGQVAGAAFDVFVVEPAKENILFGHRQCRRDAASGASTNEAQENVALQVAEQMADYLLTGAVTNALNMPSIWAEEAARLKPYMRSPKSSAASPARSPMTSSRQSRSNMPAHAAELNVKPLTATVLTALLRPQLDTVNMVNAPSICKDRNIKIGETRSTDATDYQTLIKVTVTSGNKQRSVAGTLFGGDKPRIVDDRGYRARSRARSDTCCSCATRTSRVSSAISAAPWARRGSTSRPSIWAAPRRARMRSAWSRSIRR